MSFSLINTPDKMAHCSVFDSWWVRILLIIGGFPWRRSENKLFQPTTTWRYLSLHIIGFVVFQSMTFIAYIPLGFLDVMKIQANVTNSPIELIALCLSFFATYGMYFGLVLNNVKTNAILSELLNNFVTLHSTKKSHGMICIFFLAGSWIYWITIGSSWI